MKLCHLERQIWLVRINLCYSKLALLKTTKHWLVQMKLCHSKYLENPVVKWFQQKPNLFTQKNLQRWQNQKHWNRDCKFGNWL